MDVEHLKKLLLARERELLSEIARLTSESQSSGTPDPGDAADQANVERDRSESLEEAKVLGESLAQVREALQRITDGTYGKCVVCGRPIEPARLEAIPWTPYCLEHQEMRDREANAST
jgi:DnaK suppressor protein